MVSAILPSGAPQAGVILVPTCSSCYPVPTTKHPGPPGLTNAGVGAWPMATRTPHPPRSPKPGRDGRPPTADISIHWRSC